MEVMNRLFANFNCSNLDAEVHMTKKEIFVLLDKYSHNIPESCVQVIPMPFSNDNGISDDDSVPVTTPVTQKRRKHCNDASILAATTVTAQGQTCHPK
eukprot:5695193-Ditylum_brightwellii.AAC.1